MKILLLKIIFNNVRSKFLDVNFFYLRLFIINYSIKLFYLFGIYYTILLFLKGNYQNY